MIRSYLNYVMVVFVLLVETLFSLGHGSGWSIVSIPIGIILAVYIPGFLAVEILFPHRQLKVYEHAALSLALSAAIVLTIPFALSSMGIPFYRFQITLAIDIVVILLMLIHAIRLRFLRTIEQRQVTVQKSSVVIAVICALLMVIAGGVADYNLHSFQPSFYVTNNLGKLTNYPFQIVRNDAYAMEVHVDNPTTSLLNGRVTIQMESGNTVLVDSIDVQPNHKWGGTFHLPTNTLGHQTVMLKLSVPEHPTWARNLWVTYTVILLSP